MEHVIERVAQPRVLRVKGADEAAAFPWIDPPAHLLEQPRRARPRDVVEVSEHNDRFAGIGDSSSDDDELRVAFGGFVVLAGRRRLRMHAIESHPEPAR
jgi:hypothetical protein